MKVYAGAGLSRARCQPGGRVALREVYFRYPGTPVDALAGVSFEADPAQLVALVGPSGEARPPSAT